MASPPASTIGTPRSARRTPLPTVSRLGSPSITAQYSPKKTPPRFKRATPPLVLLHVTLLPLTWPWGNLLDHVETDHLSPEAKSLREAWRQLRERVGETVSDRGILLPHPQSDYEVLEERLLETLELPLRRRARILECGHFLGPANDMSMTDDDVDSEEKDNDEVSASARPSPEKRHWCCTCRSEIRYDLLGEGRVFRVKVYASNGLMGAGAWEACWKEMERVDVELEPIVDAAHHDELVCLAVEEQKRDLAMQEGLAHLGGMETEVEDDDEHDMEREEEPEEHENGAEMEAADDSFLDQASSPGAEREYRQHEQHPSSPPESHLHSSPLFEHRRARDEERLREIYGRMPQAYREQSSPQPSDFTSCESPLPSAQAFARREHRQYQKSDEDKATSLPELIFEATKVLMQDKNTLIALLSVLILMLAIRRGGGNGSLATQPPADAFQAGPVRYGAPTTIPTAVFGQEPSAEAYVLVESEVPGVSGIAVADDATTADPCASCSPGSTLLDAGIARDASTSTVRIVETLRVVETITETELAVETQTQTRTETAVATRTETVSVDHFPATTIQEPETLPHGLLHTEKEAPEVPATVLFDINEDLTP